jgi:predicted DNA-binding transcriptional regulator AlpA
VNGLNSEPLERLSLGILRADDIDQLPLTLSTEQFAGAVGGSVWGIYDLVKRGASPIEPLRLGRKMRWRTADVLDLLGVTR